MHKTKLVRDKIPAIIKKNGCNPITHVAKDKEYWLYLKEKLREEAEEFYFSEKPEELADTLEVINAICDYKKFNKSTVENIRKKKAKDRGGFKKRIILDRVE